MVCAVTILLVGLALVVALLIAEEPQGLRALQFNLKLLQSAQEHMSSRSYRATENHLNSENGDSVGTQVFPPLALRSFALWCVPSCLKRELQHKTQASLKPRSNLRGNDKHTTHNKVHS